MTICLTKKQNEVLKVMKKCCRSNSVATFITTRDFRKEINSNGIKISDPVLYETVGLLIKEEILSRQDSGQYRVEKPFDSVVFEVVDKRGKHGKKAEKKTENGSLLKEAGNKVEVILEKISDVSKQLDRLSEQTDNLSDYISNLETSLLVIRDSMEIILEGFKQLGEII